MNIFQHRCTKSLESNMCVYCISVFVEKKFKNIKHRQMVPSKGHINNGFTYMGKNAIGLELKEYIDHMIQKSTHNGLKIYI